MKPFSMSDRFAVAYGLAAIVICLVALAVLLSGCSPTAHYIPPISSSHSAITASEYDLAESEFSGGLAPMPGDLQGAADAECQRLLDKRNLGRAFVYGLGGVTGVGGLATLIPKDATEEERKDWDLVLGIATLGTATATTILGAMVHAWTDQYERECVSETPIPSETPTPVEHPSSDEIDADGGL
jgi:hypothetical protein